MNDLEGKVILVAGASSGMGRATAKAAAAAGARLVLFARRADQLANVQRVIKNAGGQAKSISGDATEAGDVATAVRCATDSYGRLDVLVNCVGTNIKDRALSRLTHDAWSQLLRTNLDAAFTLTQAVLPTFRSQHNGLLIHIASSAAKRADASGVGYQASKAGVAALASATMLEERMNGIRVTVLFPGFTATPMVENRPVPPTSDELSKALQPGDIAHLCMAVIRLPHRAYVPEIVLSPSQP